MSINDLNTHLNAPLLVRQVSQLTEISISMLQDTEDKNNSISDKDVF